MLELKLKIVNNSIFLVDTDNNCHVIKALDIYNYIYHNRDIINNEFKIIENEVSGIQYNDVPISPSLELVLLEGKINLSLVENSVKYKNNDINFDSESQIEITDHIIIDKKWYAFPNGYLQLLADFLKKNNIFQLGTITFGQYLNIRTIKDDFIDIIDSVDPERISDIELIKKIDKVKSLQAKLYNYQKDGVSWLNVICSENLGGILADEMGLGKTLQIISTILQNEDKVNPNLVVARSTLLEHWKREFDKFTSGFSLLVHHGPHRTGYYKDFLEYDVIITSYGSVLRDISIFKMLKWNIVALDEAQDIKNPLAKRTNIIKSLQRNSSIAVTGTPLENTIIDLWSIMDFCYPGYLGTQKDFEFNYFGHDSSYHDLESKVKPLILKREISSVATQLPEKIEIPSYLRLSHNQSEKYDEIKERIKSTFTGAPSLAAITALRQYCCHPHIIDEYLDNDLIDVSPKYEHLVNILEQIFYKNEKVLIFSSYKKMINIMVYDLKIRFNVWADKIDGSVETSRRQECIDEFENINGSAILILNPKAAGAGLNITAANHVIHYNPEWNPATEDQASARAYRLGQDKPVSIHRFIYSDTLEEVMDDRLTRKREIADAIVVGNEGKDQSDLEKIFMN